MQKDRQVNIVDERINKAELRHAVYACGKRMRFQSHLGQTKVVFDNQGKNAQQCGTF